MEYENSAFIGDSCCYALTGRFVKTNRDGGLGLVRRHEAKIGKARYLMVLLINDTSLSILSLT